MADRFFVEEQLSPGDFTLEGPEAHHLATVRRFSPGENVTLFNGDGREYPAQILAIEKKRVLVHIGEGIDANRELGFVLHIASALPKGDRADFLIEKLTELGVTDFTPLVTERTVVKGGETKTEKLRRATIEASKQCGRNVLMRIHSPARWRQWCGQQSGFRLLAHPTEVKLPFIPRSEDVVVAIGPEGGFADSEVNAALTSGWELFSLGPRTLRIETAAIAAAARIGSVSSPSVPSSPRPV